MIYEIQQKKTTANEKRNTICQKFYSRGDLCFGNIFKEFGLKNARVFVLFFKFEKRKENDEQNRYKWPSELFFFDFFFSLKIAKNGF